MQSITDFRMQDGIPDTDTLIQAWLPEIEKSAQAFVPCNKTQAFFIASLRVAAKTKSLSSFKLLSIIDMSGYSRSTFFRLFENYSSFLVIGYKLVCDLSIKVYAKHISERSLTLEEFIALSADLLYGANCTIPNEITQTLWQNAEEDHLEFHTHVKELARIMRDYLNWNPATAHLQVDKDDLQDVLRILDWELLKARVDGSGDFPSVPHYLRLRRILSGYLKELENSDHVRQITSQ
ncbi:MAG: hypothetical protein ABF313_06265 [Marivita sp.]